MGNCYSQETEDQQIEKPKTENFYDICINYILFLVNEAKKFKGKEDWNFFFRCKGIGTYGFCGPFTFESLAQLSNEILLCSNYYKNFRNIKQSVNLDSFDNIIYSIAAILTTVFGSDIYDECDIYYTKNPYFRVTRKTAQKREYFEKYSPELIKIN